MSQASRDIASSGKVAAIVVAAGRGTRLGKGTPKQYREVGGRPLVAWALEQLGGCAEVEELILVVPDPESARKRLEGHLPLGKEIRYVRGGVTRQDSTEAGLAAAGDAEIVLVHDGVRPFINPGLVKAVLQKTIQCGAAVPLVAIHETLKRRGQGSEGLHTENRDRFALAQTPQGFRRSLLEEALGRARSEGYQGTDEAELVERCGHRVAGVPGLPQNLKITTPEDLELAKALKRIQKGAEPEESLRIGLGYDCHPLVGGKALWLGGVSISHPMGLSGHSDGDVVCHAAIDAMLGAAALPDIGQLFPDTDPRYRNAAGLDLLAATAGHIKEAGYRLVNLDVVVVAEEPKLAPYRDGMQAAMARALSCEAHQIGIKGKRGEGMGPAGRKEAMEAHAVALLQRTSSHREERA